MKIAFLTQTQSGSLIADPAPNHIGVTRQRAILDHFGNCFGIVEHLVVLNLQEALVDQVFAARQLNFDVDGYVIDDARHEEHQSQHDLLEDVKHPDLGRELGDAKGVEGEN